MQNSKLLSRITVMRSAANNIAAALVAFAVLSILSLPAAAEIELFGGNPLFEAIKTKDIQPKIIDWQYQNMV